jgi:hypothetical protein
MKRRGFLKNLGIGVVSIPLIGKINMESPNEVENVNEIVDTRHDVLYDPYNFEAMVHRTEIYKDGKCIRKCLGSRDHFSQEALIKMGIVKA